jgi:hypothetical protein
MESKLMLNVLNLLKNKLAKNGILIVTNPTGKIYRQENHWYTINNQFSENIPTRKSEHHIKMKYHEDQPIKLQVFASKQSSQSFTFFDYFHSGSAYRNAYSSVGLELLKTYKPIGNQNDSIEWKSEAEIPAYKIHILGK